MGKNLSLEEIKGKVSYKVIQDEKGGVVCLDEKIPFENMALYLIQNVVDTAKEQFGQDIHSITISVPHGFNNDQRNAIRSAAESIEGINEVYIINDPLSTGIYYISKNKLLNSEYFLIIDFGSSKLDISLLSISKNNSIRVRIRRW